MGRGRAKAKQTKVARELKYRSFGTDFSSLERELRHDEGHEVPPAYAELAEEYQTDDEDDPSAEPVEDLRKSG